jgi:sugar lactone lactonase YvrE
MTRIRLVLTVCGLAAAALVLVTAAAADKGGKGQGKGKGNGGFPTTISLPNGWAPEGIDIEGKTFYVGSIPTGDIYRGSLQTGAGAVFINPPDTRAAIGIDVDGRGRLFVAGGGTGKAWVYDAATGADITSYQLTTLPAFINDVVATRQAVWFTDSQNQVLYKLALGPHGELAAQAQTVPLTGDIKFTPGFNANGIDATRDGKTLVIVQSNEGLLFTVDAATGLSSTIDLGGARVRNGDGILLHGNRLYVVQNQDNLISTVKLRHHLGSGQIVRELTDPRFQVPTTIDRFGNRLYAVNARFGTPVTPMTTYTVVAVPK